MFQFMASVPAAVDSSALEGFVKNNVIKLLLFGVVAAMLLKAFKGENKTIMRIVVGVMLALVVLGVANSTSLQNSISTTFASMIPKG